ncbi:hypothetical protein GF327_06200 [Candidatus Woesearchaeota archaeon]|nr:hypothetical protein [Candidatus Woesearchaeota archaeon]
MNKKGIELSVNFLVLLIISIVIFSFGIIFATRILNVGKKAAEGLPEIEEIALKNCMRSGNYVCISKDKADLKPGDTKLFEIGLTNDLENTAEFKYKLDLAKAIDEQGNDFSTQIKTPPSTTWREFIQDNWLGSLESEVYTLKRDADKRVRFLFEIQRGSPPGTYIWNLKICTDDTSVPNDPDFGCTGAFNRLYGGNHKIYITVI